MSVMAMGLIAEETDTSRGYIYSLLKRGDRYIVSTTVGLFEAGTEEKRWRKLVTPKEMESPGSLVQAGEHSSMLAFYVPEYLLKGPKAKENPGGLFVSWDGGNTWTRTSDRRDIETVYLHPNGKIYAVVTLLSDTEPMAGPFGGAASTRSGNGPWKYITHPLLISEDGGKTWRNISRNIPVNFEIRGFFQDPDHPALVCFIGSSRPARPSFVFHAVDDSYDWMMTPKEEWKGGELLQKSFFSNSYSMGNHSNIQMCAMLDTFFILPFLQMGDPLSIHAILLQTEKSEYSFRRGESIRLPVKVISLIKKDLRFLDTADESVFWGLKVKPAGKKGVAVSPKVSALNIGSFDRKEKIDSVLHDPGLLTVNLDDQHPYQRVIELSKLYNFSQPGIYEVQLFHYDGPVVEWQGAFGGSVIKISIVE
jgi:hypothetical protein